MPQPRDEKAWRPGAGYLAIAIVLAAGLVALLLYWWLKPEPAAQVAAPPTASRAAAPAAVATAPVPQPAAVTAAPVPAVEGDADPTRDLRSYVMRGENPTMAEVIKRLHERGIYSGLGAFNPPGTSPPLQGLAVPEDFVLPPGYVRHHQVTDDGQPIEAVLMFAPDFQPVDASGRPITVPQDRVVPPELAPPGMPLRRITIPAPRDGR